MKNYDPRFARLHRLADGREILIPILRGGSPELDNLFPEIPEDLTALSVEELEAFVAEGVASVERVAADPAAFVTDERTSEAIRAELTAGVAAIKAARTELASRAAAEEPEAEETEEPAEEPEADAELAADVAALAADLAVDPEPEIVEPEPVVAAAPPAAPAAPARRPAGRPARSRTATPPEVEPERVALTAAAGASDLPLGSEFPSGLEIADAMIRRRDNLGLIPEDVRGEKVPIARGSWKSLYPAERRFSGDELANEALVAAATNKQAILAEFNRLKKDALVASGGLCAPVTPYYQLMDVSTADRPVRAALPSFQADRGGIRYARPATLADVTSSDATGIRTATQDAAGGTTTQKTCQAVSCPQFEETDVDIIFHCLQFGNLGARTFPERVAQWNNLTLAAHARLAESNLLTGIDAFSTQVTAGSLGLGATAALLGQILAAANGMRNRHRMSTDAILRLMVPEWAIDLLVSDVIRSQFQRFDTDEARITALLRSFNIEPTFYIDSANGRSQVFGAQADGALLPFPENVVWYLYEEGAFLYLDGGTLELGIVRDSVLNATNDFQIFGETFENVAYVGIEALAVESPVCDSGTVALPQAVTCPINYTLPS